VEAEPLTPPVDADPLAPAPPVEAEPLIPLSLVPELLEGEAEPDGPDWLEVEPVPVEALAVAPGCSLPELAVFDREECVVLQASPSASAGTAKK
jgi:hypothetical protein